MESDFLVAAGEAGQRLDVFLAERLADLSRSQLQRLIGAHSVLVNGAPVKSSARVEAGDLIHIERPAPRPSRLAPQPMDLPIVYEDADLLVIDKPKGLVVHPAPGAEEGTLVHALLAHCQDLSGIGGEERPGIVHRLDKNTTGLMVVAKNDVAHNALQAQIQRRQVRRRYLALVWGNPSFDEAVIDAPIGRHPSDRTKMAVIHPGTSLASRPSLTEVTVRERLGPMTLIECRLQTGRTHQIRVHCQFAGHPVVGDPVYGGIRPLGPEYPPALRERILSLTGQALHAVGLSFRHPRTGEGLSFEAPLPAEMAGLLDGLRKGRACPETS